MRVQVAAFFPAAPGWLGRHPASGHGRTQRGGELQELPAVHLRHDETSPLRIAMIDAWER
jgi:hypothetical protein